MANRHSNEDNYESYSEDQYELSQRDYTDWEIEYYPDRNDGWYVRYINQKQDEETNIKNNE